MPERGTRVIDGRYYMLFNAMDLFTDDDEENLEREAEAARKSGRYEYVRVIRDRRRYRGYVYVL
jgi:hypothetical protein